MTIARIKTYSELYLEAVEKDNQRVGKEWNAIAPTTKDRPEAVDLAALQGNRSKKLAERYGYAHCKYPIRSC